MTVSLKSRGLGPWQGIQGWCRRRRSRTTGLSPVCLALHMYVLACISAGFAAPAGVSWKATTVFRSGPTVPHAHSWNKTRDALPQPWVQKFMNDSEMANFSATIANETFPGFDTCFKSLRPMAFRADMFRLALLYTYGGIWMDLTAELLVPLTVLIKPTVDLILVHERPGFNMDYGILNNFMGAKAPGSPFLKLALNEIITNCLRREYGKNEWSITGPEILGRVYERAKQDGILDDSYILWLQHAPEGGFIIKDSGNGIRLKVVETKHVADATKLYGSNSYRRQWHARQVFHKQ
eukprot:m.23241 g.23241  ORF g.23241 m.23241 type:complete len:294 (+) comp4065_c0_seq1:1774-2655(+)